jgi:TolA-binding protein
LDAIYARAYSRYAQKNYAAARKDFTALLNQYPNSPHKFDATYQSGNCYFILKDFKNALSAYKSAQQILNREQPNEAMSIRTSFQIARTLSNMDRLNNAIKEFELIYENYPSSEFADDALFEVASLNLRQLNKPENAIILYQKLITNYPNSTYLDNSYIDIGNAYYNLQNYENAIINYNYIISNFPHSRVIGDAVTGVQDSYLILGKIDAANSVVENYVKQNPQSKFSVELLLKNADSYLVKEQPDKAISQFIIIINNYPEDPLAANALLGLGDAYLIKGNTGNAISYYEKISTNYPKSAIAPFTLVKLGEIYSSQGQDSKAEEAFRKEIRNYPNSQETAAAYLGIGMAQEKLDKIGSAKANYQFIIDNYPETIESDNALNKLGRIIAVEGAVPDAIQRFKTVIARRTDAIAAEAQYLIGWSHLSQDNYSIALEELLKVRYLYSRHEYWVYSATLDAALCQEKLNKNDEAIKLYNIVLENNSANQFADEATDGLNRLTNAL